MSNHFSATFNHSTDKKWSFQNTSCYFNMKQLSYVKFSKKKNVRNMDTTGLLTLNTSSTSNDVRKNQSNITKIGGADH